MRRPRLRATIDITQARRCRPDEGMKKGPRTVSADYATRESPVRVKMRKSPAEHIASALPPGTAVPSASMLDRR